MTGTQSVREALRARRRVLHRVSLPPGDRSAELVSLAEAAGVPVAQAKGEEAGRGPAQAGITLEAGPLPECALEDLMVRDLEGPRTLVALDGVEDPQNLGAIARVADAAGVAGLVLTHRRAPPLSPAVSRASAGAVEWLPVARVPNLRRALNQLKDQGFWIFGADPEGAESLFGVPEAWLRGDRVLVLGAEGRGLRSGVLAAVDHRVRIPMAGRVASLNVAAAAAVILFEMARRRESATSP